MRTVTDVDRLFAVPLEDFVAERKQVAKELRTAGEREAAAEVAKLPKPTPPAWALNQLARDEPALIGAWLDAAEELRAVSESPGAGLRDAIAAHRDATRTLIGIVRERARPGGKPLSEPMLERVRELLQAATVDGSVADALRAGRVVEGAELPAFAATSTSTAAGKGVKGAGRGSTRARSADADDAAAPARAAASGAAARRAAAAERRAAKEREAERKAKERAERQAELERHIRAAEEELARLREEAAERDAAVAAADERLEEARRTLHRSESEAAAAHAAADEMRAAVATAERELRQLARQLRSASS
jgi:hypothetical protein